MITPGHNLDELKTALRGRDEQLRSLRSELVQVQQEQSELLAMVAHEQEQRLRARVSVEWHHERDLSQLRSQLAAQQPQCERLEREAASLRAKNRILMQALAADHAALQARQASQERELEELRDAYLSQAQELAGEQSRSARLAAGLAEAQAELEAQRLAAGLATELQAQLAAQQAAATRQ